MSILLLTSPGGAPGLTTTALGLALCWPRDVLLLDADPCTCRPVESGYLGGRVAAGPGLIELAGAHRDGGDVTAALWSQVMSLPCPPRRSGERDDSRLVGMVGGYGHLGQAALMSLAWPAVVDALLELGDAGVDVLVDLGRMGTDPVPDELVRQASVVGVVTGSGLRHLAALSMRAEQVEALSRTTTGTLGLVVVGAGSPYGSREISSQFHLPVIAEVAGDPRAAAVLSDGTNGARWYRSRHAATLTATATALDSLAARRRRAVTLEGDSSLTGAPSSPDIPMNVGGRGWARRSAWRQGGRGPVTGDSRE